MKNLFHLFIFCVLLTCCSLPVMAQDDNTLNFNTENGVPIVDDEFELDTVGFDSDNFDYVDNDVAPVYFLYFKWMPGFGTYDNFNIASVHYKHERTAPADTLILGKYCHPAPYKIYSKYGWRRRRMHRGVDLSYPMGTPVVAAFDGIVRISNERAGGYGQLIVIRHFNKLETYYGHLSQRFVNPGQMVHAGDTIGLGGSTGRSTGPHLHFETRYLGCDFNPTKIIDFNNFKLAVDTLYTSGFQVATKQVVVNDNGGNTSSSSSSSNKIYHKVRRGETLGGIAKKYHTYVSTLKKLNGLRSDFIREGQRLRVR